MGVLLLVGSLLPSSLEAWKVQQEKGRGGGLIADVVDG